MARIVEIAVLTSALAGIATFLGFRAFLRKAVRTLRRPAQDPPPPKQLEERKLHES